MKRSHVVATIFWVFLIATGIVEIELELAWAQTTGFAGLTAIVGAGLAFGWVITDAKENGIQIPGALKIATVALALIAVPYYRFKYFGAIRGLKFIAVVIVLFGATILLTSAIGSFIRPADTLYIE